MTRTPAGQIYRPSITIITRPEPGVLMAYSPLWNCGNYTTPDELAETLDQFTVDTPFRADCLNKLRDSFRALQRTIQNGHATHPLWDAENGFRLAYGLLNKCAERIGLVKLSFGYRAPLDQYGESM